MIEIVLAAWIVLMVSFAPLSGNPAALLVSAFTAAGYGLAGSYLGALVALVIWMLMEVYYAPEVGP